MSDVHVEAVIHIQGENDDSYGGDVFLKRNRGEFLISLSAHGPSGVWGSGRTVLIDPSKLRDALDKLVSEDLGK